MEEDHKFWKTQPVNIPNSQKSKQPLDLKLPPEFILTHFDNNEIDEVVDFLKNNYVEDKESKFRLEYSKEFIEWQLDCPNKKQEYTLCLKNNSKIFGFVHGRHMKFKVNGEVLDLAFINFLCLHKELRNKRLAPVLIDEIRKRFNKNGIEKAIFTGGIKLPFSFARARFYHYLLNIPKLERLGFCKDLKSDENLVMRKGVRLLESKDLEQFEELYLKELKKYKFAEIHDKNSLKYSFIPKKNIVTTLVFENNGKITEFGTFIRVDSFAIESGEKIKIAYLYMRNSDEIVADIISFSKSEGYDVFNCLSIMGNMNLIDNYDFFIGTGVLNYYLFNHDAKDITLDEISFYLP
ncbi:Glycylpeptide N-tetradecanoyltransferase [Dictyocoela muelleri]|nr:Glycylpeptide N-tetradecanoyltransferase [Dictyocoela muelleri]